MYLENLKPKEIMLSYGTLGVNGSMGYPIIPSINGQSYNHCISTHASSIVKYEINKQFNSFHSYIALNDSSSEKSLVEFQVICDGVPKYVSTKVKKFDKLRPINVDISETNILELRCFNFEDSISHSIWIDPVLNVEKINHHIGPFNNAYIDLNFEKKKSKYASIVFASENMAEYLYAFLKTFQKNSNLKDCVNYVVIAEESHIIRKIAKHFNAVILKSNKTNNYTISSAIDLKDSTYTIAKHIDAEYFVISDIDILVNKDLTTAFIDGKIGICRDCNTDENSFGELISNSWSAYKGDENCLHLLKVKESEYVNKDILNSGFITGSKREIMLLEDQLKSMLPESQFYLCFNNDALPREQALINLALLRTKNYQILDYSFNQQLLYMPVIENACLHLNAQESKKTYSHLVGKECDADFKTLNKSLLEDYFEDNGFNNILCIGDLNLENKISNNDWVRLKELSKNVNKYDCIVYEHDEDISNTKIKLHLMNQIMNEGKLIVLTTKENIEIFNLLDIEYEILGKDIGKEIIVIEK